MILRYSQYSNTAPPSSQWQVLQTQGVPSCNTDCRSTGSQTPSIVISCLRWCDLFGYVRLRLHKIAQCLNAASATVYGRGAPYNAHTKMSTPLSRCRCECVSLDVLCPVPARAQTTPHAVWTAETHDAHVHVRRFVWG
jgi:hypothetical protein